MEEPAITIEPDPVQRKFYVAEMATARNGDVESYISTEAIDRMGDVIVAAGWQLDAYRKSGSPVLFGHEQGLTAAGIPHIGNAVAMEIQRQGLWSVTRFHEKTQLSREAALLAREKLMPSWSVGFTPLDRPDVRKSDDGEMLGFIFKRQELLEYSLVPVPANPEAVSRAMHMHRKGLISAQTAAILAGPSPQAEPDSGQDEDVQKALDYIRAVNLAAYIRRQS
jgi:HK97 family phage prohead protease